MEYPRVFLAIDNCFAYKRWTRPADWAGVISDLGVSYIEASADTELDPLYMGRQYLAGWAEDVRAAEQRYGVKVANLYSGHGTYTTLGLNHTDARVRMRFINEWFMPMVDTAAALGAGFGFLVHGFPEFVLQDRTLYENNLRSLVSTLASINAYAKTKGCGALSIEQMYCPTMPPWTITGTVELMKSVERQSGNAFYYTEDVGHHHTKFCMPTEASIRDAFAVKRRDGLWLGTERAAAIYERALCGGELPPEGVAQILQDAAEHPYLFSAPADGDCYEWLKRIGRLAPIIHLQQTDGCNSDHRPFTEKNNSTGVVRGESVLRALKRSYDEAPDEGRGCREVYLTLELFAGAAVLSQDILRDCRASVEYWRRFIPEDGLTLDKLTDNLGGKPIS